MKILLLNAGYFLGFDGSTKNYILHSYRYIYCPNKIIKEKIKLLKETLTEEEPEIVCVTEIDKGSLNTGMENQMLNLIGSEYPKGSINRKYSYNSRLRDISFFNGKSNGFLTKKGVRFEKTFLKNGTKRLMHQILTNEGIRIILVHLSLNKRTRTKQIMEISKMLIKKDKTIICGDLNTLGGYEELKCLTEGSNLRIINGREDFTFPAYSPKKTLDFFICSNDLKIKEFRIINKKISDHLPVILEVEI